MVYTTPPKSLQSWAFRDLPPLLTYKHAAILLGVSRRTVSRACHMGDLVRVQVPGTTSPKGYRVTLDSVEAYALQNNFFFPWMEGDEA